MKPQTVEKVRTGRAGGPQTLEMVLAGIHDELRKGNGENLPSFTTKIGGEAAVRPSPRERSRLVGPNATEEFAQGVADGSLTVTEKAASGLGESMQKALALGTDTAGGFLVQRELAGEILGMIRNRSAVMQLGCRVIPNIGAGLDLTSMSAGASASYVAENAAIPVSEQTFAQVGALAPKELAALVPVSLKLLRIADGNPAVEEIIRADLAEVMALRADLAFLSGAGGASPLGIKSTPGTTAGPDLGVNGRTPTFDDLKAVVAKLRALNAPFQRPGWIFNSRLLATLETLKTANGDYIADNPALLSFDATGASGRLLGYPFQTTGQIGTNIAKGTSTDTTWLAFSSDWQNAWVGEEEELAIAASGQANYLLADGVTWVSAFQNRQMLFRALISHDFSLIRPTLVVVLEGIRP